MCLLSASAAASGSSPISVTNAWVRLVPPVASNSAAYFSIHNHSEQADTLLAVSSPVAGHTTLHGTELRNGMMRMVEAGPLTIPAQGTVTLDTGGLHLMLMKLRQPLQANTTVMLHLEFEKAGSVMVEALVAEQAPESAAKAPVSSHDHHHGHH